MCPHRGYYRFPTLSLGLLLGLGMATLAGCSDGASSSRPPTLSSVPAPQGPVATTGGLPMRRIPPPIPFLVTELTRRRES